MSEVGQMLRCRRKERGITLKDIEGALSIRVKYLEALENGDYSIIPGEVYVKGFLRNYAGFLGLNAEEMIKLYKEESQPPVVPAEGEKEKQESASELKPRKGSGRSFGLGTVASLLVAAIGAFFLYTSLTNKVPPETAEVPPAGKTPAPAAPSAPPAQNTVIPAAQGITLAVKATADCWVMVVTDGTENFEGLLHSGDTKTWQAKNKVEITVGNAGGIQIIYNEQPQAPLGVDGEVAHRVYTLRQ